ncbi:MAG: hypothetical protein AB8I08_13215 [Sandaracinaceae bacterium]
MRRLTPLGRDGMPRDMRIVIVSLLSLLVVAGCDDTTPTDAGAARDAGAADAGAADAGAFDAGRDAGAADAGRVDAGTDAGAVDAGTDAGALDADTDAGATDSGTDAGFDGGWDAAAGCHGVGFGEDAVTIETPSGPAPAPTGGVIPLGAYDLLRVQNYGGETSGTMRSTWVFRDSTTLATLTAAALSPGSSLPEATPRLNTWSTDGTSLTRTETCGGTDSATVGYSMLVSGAVTVLRLHAAPGLILTYRLRP